MYKFFQNTLCENSIQNFNHYTSFQNFVEHKHTNFEIAVNHIIQSVEMKWISFFSFHCGIVAAIQSVGPANGALEASGHAASLPIRWGPVSSDDFENSLDIDNPREDPDFPTVEQYSRSDRFQKDFSKYFPTVEQYKKWYETLKEKL